MTRLLLDVPHVPQRFRGDCLAASAAMVLNYLNVQIPYRRLVTTLRINKSVGTGFFHIQELGRFNLSVSHGRGTLDDLRAALQNPPALSRLLQKNYHIGRKIVITQSL